MIKRPTKSDTENHILQMQNDFYAEQNREKNFQPAAQFVRMKRDGAEAGPKKSEFAKKRNLKKQPEPVKEEPRLENTVIGDIVEKTYRNVVPMEIDTNRSESGFPKAIPLKIVNNSQESSSPPKKRKSLFAQMVNIRNVEPSEVASECLQSESSNILEGAEAKQIHEENIRTLNEMSREQILEEQQNLVETLDPKMLEFLKLRKKLTKPEVVETMEHLEVAENTEKPEMETQEAPNLEVLDEQGAANWLHFDVLEPEKLEWTQNIRDSLKDLKPGDTFEARFDWKGVLLPYVDKNKTKDERELYLHGEEATRPGYSLQELFRLARSNVLQQRISALSSIAGILNIFSQGFYDGILELPISKIFFFLRFALDENTPPIIEAASRAIAHLFYNDTDETLLDTIFETKQGLLQPEMSLNLVEKLEETDNLENKFSDMNLMSKKTPKKVHFETKIDDDDQINEQESMNDFHLAETDLIQCLLRTNILERIRYILFTLQPESPTVVSCVKILIRLARTDRETATQILQNEFLMSNLIKGYVIALDGFEINEPQPIILKLFRILCSHHPKIYATYLRKFHLVELVKGYIFTREDINLKMIQMQIETFRLFRTLLNCNKDDILYRELLPPSLYLLEWHYQYLRFEENGPFVIRQHCAALLSLIGSSASSQPISLDKFFLCLCKWFSLAAKHGVNEFSQKILLTSCLDAAWRVKDVAPRLFNDFVADFFVPFLKSAKLSDLMKHLINSTLFDQESEDRSGKIGPLLNLGGILTKENQSKPTLIITKTYPSFFLTSILDFIQSNDDLLKIFLHNPHLVNYLKKFTVSDIDQLKLVTNWFLKTEILFLLNILNLVKSKASKMDIKFALKLSFQVLLCLSEEYSNEIIILYDRIIFDKSYYVNNENSASDMQRWKFIYKIKLQSLLQCEPTNKTTLTVANWRTPMLKKYWPYSLLYAIVDKLETSAASLELFSEDDIIKTSMLFTELLERNGVRPVTHTDKLMYIMTTFLGPDSKFLEPQITEILGRRIDSLRSEIDDEKFNLDVKLEQKKSFQSLYQVFLDVFQSSSYGHSLFSILVMIPVSQKYDIKWRNMVWSEHVAVLRFITCTETQLFGVMADYLHPEESDKTLIKFYAQALASNLLRQGSVPHKIAAHHLQCFKIKCRERQQYNVQNN